MTEGIVVVVGAGVIGLSTAITLQQAGKKVMIVAEFMPGDPKHIRYTSCWAGAHHVSVAGPEDHQMHRFDMETFQVMSKMLRDDPDAPLMFRPQIEYRTFERNLVNGVDQLSLIAKYSPNFRMLEKSELPPDIPFGATFDTLMIDTPSYLPYILKKFTDAGGVVIRSTLKSLTDVFQLPPLRNLSIAAVVNCTGLGARELVKDQKVFPTRGQLVIVRAPWIKEGVMRLGPKGSGIYTYTIPRKSGNVIIGGTADANDSDPKPRPHIAKLIKERGLAMCPDLLPPSKRGGTIDDLDVVEDVVGLRPTRIGGIRIEADTIVVGNRRVPLVHHYGHGGYGYQTSWGSAREAVRVLLGTLDSSSRTKSKL
ncbi:FAD dependent oxidoreductase [Meredithblackwellia eburnea MCA 4105]